MNTDIEYLKLLDRDLEDAALRATVGPFGPAAPAGRRRAGRLWVRVAGAAAAFLVVAGAIGFIAGGGADSSGPGAFQVTNDAVASGGATGDGLQGLEPRTGDEAAPNVGEEAPAAGAPSPAPNTVGAGYRGDDEAFEDEPLFLENVPGQRQQQDLSKVVRDGRIGIVVPDGTFGDAVGDLTTIAEGTGGFVFSSSTRNERSGTFVLRIPARRLDRAIGAIRDLGDVRFQEISADDVTAEFIDLQARLRILEERRALLLELSQDATTTDAVLRFANLIDDVQLQIERMQGQIRFINDQVAQATLRVTIEERNAPSTEPPTTLRNPNLGSALDLAVQGSLRIVSAVIVGLGYLIPLTILGAIVWLVVVAVRRRTTGV